MYEKCTRQALPEKDYRELLGTALCVFNSNNAFVIEEILKEDANNQYNWYQLIDLESGRLKDPIKKTINQKLNNTLIADLFDEVVTMRNRIIHSFQITDKDGMQKLATKDRNGVQFVITQKYLLDFIKKNEELSTELHNFRGC